ncbi:MAG: hypothetical protein BWY84_00517 [Candidatus Aerophobetes bacterium ADurb.Bin490]|nr:MAG: hypothetical protein BWY84_00517 [Candidatus Aerophobetes bacterium ADurb.Bin490]HPI02429.1 DNA-processing protein DprA [Candidatus Goldiibacteriota bacterium]HPN64784.1 DNA-processing protein DprA [Candidatus Goldiibacteriota bacterium]HRQ42837.1 DNA-processing protein DprA [Candidatus Goldiibacteriota bacterium]
MGKFCTEKDALIAINTIPAIGGIKLRRLINVFGSCLDIFDASPEMLTAVEGIGVETAKDILALTPEITEREEEACQKNSVRIICSDDIEYPKQLKTIYDPPPVLYMAGADYRETALPLAIVGTRQCTEYGDAAVRRVVQRMRAIFSDFSVISGLATGIDSRAHRAALNSGIYTAGVLGFGFGQLLTMINRPLIKEMLEKATIISEFPFYAEGLKQNFPQRNRVISGLSKGVLVVEAGEKSGTMITADFALEQGREVFAIPGSIFSLKSRGANRLISQGAKIVQDADDILIEFFEDIKIPDTNAETAVNTALNLTESEKTVYEKISFEKKHVDIIALESNIDVIKLSSTLTMLEMKGAIRQLAGMNFVRNR